MKADEPPTLALAINSPKHVTSIAFNGDGSVLAVGADDGSVRFYGSDEVRVKKAIRALGAPASSIQFGSGKDSNRCWIASGSILLQFSATTTPETIISRENALFTKQITLDNDDALNGIALSANGAYVAATGDGGSVWVLDVGAGEISEMKTRHTSIAWTASFIPDRPNELISAGYDCTLLHFDFKQRILLSRFEIPATPPLAPGISSLPPFVTALAVSTSGVVSVGTADGRVWVGLGGDKVQSGSSKPKKSRKWGGLSANDGFMTKVGENMITGLTFVSPDIIISCSLHGKLVAHQLNRPENKSSARTSEPGLHTLWHLPSENRAFSKVDSLAFHAGTGQVAIGGLHASGKGGGVEVWSLAHPEVREEGSTVEGANES